jgi:hypothetical protein
MVDRLADCWIGGILRRFVIDVRGADAFNTATVLFVAWC